MKLLILIRGVPGSGKSTLARRIVCSNATAVGPFEADTFMTDPTGEYRFDPARLGFAHGQCLKSVENAMVAGHPTIVQSNTNITRKDMQPYIDLATTFGYVVQEITVKANFENTHGVPPEKVEQMRARFQP